MASYLHHNTRILRKRLPEVFEKFRRDGVKNRHMTSLVVFHGKSLKGDDVIRKLCMIRHWDLIYHLELCNSFHLVGQPTFYDIWFSDYHACSAGHNVRFFDDVIKKMLTSAKICWQYHKSECFWNVGVSVYFHTKNWGYSTFCSDFIVGGHFLPPPITLTYIKSPITNRVKSEISIQTICRRIERPALIKIIIRIRHHS